MSLPRRSTPWSCRHEPPFPHHHTVLFVSGSDHVAHAPHVLCEQEGPHPIAGCGECHPRPVRTERGRWACPWPGCPDSRQPAARRIAQAHAEEAHTRCSCGRWFGRLGGVAHRRAVRWRHITHPPFPGERPNEEAEA